MTIKTYVSNAAGWNMVVDAQGNNNINTWDPTKINWTDYTITPVDITWTGINPDPLIGGAVPMTVSNPQDFYINGDTTWATTAVTFNNFTKPAGVRPDVLMGFFSQYIHALMFITEESTYVMQFMERLGLIWIQHEANKWTAYDRKEFYEFIDNPDLTIFVGTPLNKRDIQKRISEAKDE